MMTSMLLRSILLAAVSVCMLYAQDDQDVLLKPIEGTENFPAVAMLFATGAGLPPSSYTPLAVEMQKSLAAINKALWVGIPHCTLDVAAIDLNKAYQRMADKLTAEGLPTQHGTIYAGHSLGGAMTPLQVNDTSSLPEGFNSPDAMILMGAFLVRDFKSEAVPEVGPGQYMFNSCPVLTIGGELDGLARITRIAEAYHTQINMNTDVDHAKHYFPVTVVEGMSHMQFSSGDIPKLVEMRDLLPEISYNEAHQYVSADVASFLNGVYNNDYSKLDTRLEQSLTLFDPIIKALELEGYHQFKPPCYCEAEDEYGGLIYGSCPELPGCQANSPWTQRAQEIMAIGADSEGLQIVTRDSQHVVTEEHPSCHLPNVHDGTDTTTGEKLYHPNDASINPGNGDASPLCSNSTTCTLNITTLTQLKYETGSELDFWRITIGSDAIDTGYFPISAREMKSKMKSRQAILQAANDPSAGHDNSQFDDLDSPEEGRCAEINLAALNYAKNIVPESTIERYSSHGQLMKINQLDHKVCAAGPCWIWSPLRYENRSESEIFVQSPTFAEKNSNGFPCGEDKVIPCPAGMHYCKLLSPARAVEWMYVDSLRKYYSLNSLTKKKENEDDDEGDAKCCTTCGEGTLKYYSIPKIQDNCGESCLNPDDYKKYKLFEPGLTLADTNTPCADRNYSIYLGTFTHGSPKLNATLDMYDHQEVTEA